MYAQQLYRTLVELVGIPSTSGHEEQVRDYLKQHLVELGLTLHIDPSGNLIGLLNGRGRPLLLNAHMDRVPPGRGHQPILRDGVLYSDGTTNLGADDAAGITVILEILRRVHEQHLPHPPLVIVFTVQEEAGLCGARDFDCSTWGVADGIVFDNAFESGVVVSQGAIYESFDITIKGRTGHPGKDLALTVNALEIFRAARYPHGSLKNDQTRITIGRVIAGTARNAIPATVTVEGEIRSFESTDACLGYRKSIENAFLQAAQAQGGTIEATFKTLAEGYYISQDEPVLEVYRKVLESRGEHLSQQPTFIGSDTSGFRRTARVFTLSTGVMHEHSFEEYVALEPLEQLVQDSLQILQVWSETQK